MAHPAAAREIPPRLELDCLKALWVLGEANVRQVQAALMPDRVLAYTTVMTIMDRLARRGCVERRKCGRSFLYAPMVSKDTIRRAAIRDLVDSLFDGSDVALVEYLSTPIQ
jgi:predicted transcriptional regulator